MSPSGLELKTKTGPVAYATGRDVSPSGLELKTKTGPVAYATGRDVSPSGLELKANTGPVAYATGRDVSPSGRREQLQKKVAPGRCDLHRSFMFALQIELQVEIEVILFALYDGLS